jgi:hypothetical protein
MLNLLRLVNNFWPVGAPMKTIQLGSAYFSVQRWHTYPVDPAT